MTRTRSRDTLLVLAMLLAAGCTSRTTGAPAPQPSSPLAVTPPADMLPDPDAVLSTRPTTADPAAAATATLFVARWARPTLPAAQWRADVRPYAVPGYADLLNTVDPANVPATRITAPGRVVTATPERAEVDVGTDAGVLRVVCVRDGQRWLVANVGMSKAGRR
ncbi:hypothetical protein ABZ671_29585 [Micromonospora sp. NPDC006766]|uniref:hypothetical protein n=1 Tax=Micromonospora sp. NPDC006766 TaxID=3154778 RepID=UPI003403C232